MKSLILLAPIFLISCVHAQTSEIKQYTVDSEYIIRVACEENLEIHLVKKNKKVFSLGICGNNEEREEISFNDNFLKSGKKSIHISPSMGNILITSSEEIYIVDTTIDKIVYAGSLPIIAEEQEDGTVLYEAVAPNCKVKEIYYLSDDNKIVELKSTALYFQGQICIRTRKTDDPKLSTYVDSNCPEGIAATQAAPVCVTRSQANPSNKIIPLNECDIKKEEVSGLRE